MRLKHLYAASCYDHQLNLSSLCSMEVIDRRLQAMVVDAYAVGSPEKP